jgi:hypothetical protein
LTLHRSGEVRPASSFSIASRNELILEESP